PRAETPRARKKRNTDREFNERVAREKPDCESPPNSEKRRAHPCSCSRVRRLRPLRGITASRVGIIDPSASVERLHLLRFNRGRRARCADLSNVLFLFHWRKCAQRIAGSARRSSRVRKSIVANSRSIAGGPQIFAPIARYARNNFDDALQVVVAGGGDPGRPVASFR